MSSPLDGALLLGIESTYGTAAALTRGYEGQSDTMKREPQFLESIGFRAGLQGLRADRRHTRNMGASGSLTVDVLNKGMGLLMKGLLGTATAPVQQASTTAYVQTYESNSSGPDTSYTFQAIRPRVGTTTKAFTYLGTVPTGWKITQSNDGLFMLEVDFDAQTEVTTEAAGTPAYPAGADVFDWTQAQVEVDSVAFCSRTFEFAADLAMKTDRRRLCGTELKQQPVRAGVPDYTGTLAKDYENEDLYDAFVNGDVLPITCTWTGANIEGAYNYEVKLTLAACQFDGETPEMSLDDLPMQNLPYKVLDNGTDPMVLVEITSTDTAI